jgi:hypothetical protein
MQNYYELETIIMPVNSYVVSNAKSKIKQELFGKRSNGYLPASQALLRGLRQMMHARQQAAPLQRQPKSDN